MSEPSPPPPAPTATERPNRTARPRSARGQHVDPWLADWLGIALIFITWCGMQLLTVSLVILPRLPPQGLLGWLHLSANLRLLASNPLTESAVSPTYALPAGAAGLAIAFVGLAASPLLLAFGAALIAKWQQSPRARHHFMSERDKSTPEWTEREKKWKHETAERIQEQWEIESRRALQAQHRMMQHACMYGFAASAVLGWSLIMNSSTSVSCQTRMMAIAAASGAMTSFSLSFGRISVRASIRDTSARMFAYALRAMLTAVVAAVLLTALLWHESVSSHGGQLAGDIAALSDQPLKSPASFLMLGMVVALVGEGILSQLTTRATTALHLATAAAPSDGLSNLSLIDGLTENDLIRLGEERIDSVHALALASTADLYFSTQYTLPRLVDWQDQALLISHVGFARAQSYREKLMIRGAMDLQRKADFLIAATHESDPIHQADKDKAFEIIRSSLGFISLEQARETLFPMANDESVRRLRIYQRGSVYADGHHPSPEPAQSAQPTASPTKD